jgi:hypothetical protein
MRVTLVGLLVWIAVAVLLVYAVNELSRTTQADTVQPPQNPDASTNP